MRRTGACAAAFGVAADCGTTGISSLIVSATSTDIVVIVLRVA